MEADRYEMSVGIYTNKHLAPMLAEEGHGDEAMKYLFNRNFISFSLGYSRFLWPYKL